MSLTDEAYRRLRAEIVSVGLAPGAEVSEARLVNEFALSTAAVRGALARLRAEGLVDAVPRRGHVVSAITLRDVDEVFQMRLLLEPEAAALAAVRIDERTLESLRDQGKHDYDPASREGVAGFLAANREFHVGVAEASGNGRLAAVITRLLGEAERATHLALAAGAGERGLRLHHEHDDLVDALAGRDQVMARWHMTTALESFRGELTEILRSSEQIMTVAL
ncbi:DNA-binding GntR family transcriptional regulator [Herbihabitans rhizosphaerae]|uniref:DNA-binding GntR family transcriptional regulator n=2 Tax=Herbihabitans rhizosphaerae TaxID=1872711 RepID=A0A4Q7KIX7_9PSEU|nr:DNA-binding GntR family transcriptional regulator [Herbihabitans rhizosphaerae]